MVSASVKIGIIGGSGFNNPALFTDVSEVNVTTEFGPPSDVLLEGKIEGIPCVLLARHGRKHSIMPSAVNFRANLLSLKMRGCTHILVSTACGSLREKITPGDFVIIDQFIDRTTKRSSTFYDGSSENFCGILHIPMDAPFCGRMRGILTNACTTLGYPVHEKGTVVTIEGPRYSCKAESNMFRMLGGDVINMTTVPEVVLARELGLSYAAFAMATDYDCWKEGDAVSVDKVLATMKSNINRGIEVVKKAVVEIAAQDWSETIAQTKKAVQDNVMLAT